MHEKITPNCTAYKGRVKFIILVWHWVGACPLCFLRQRCYSGSLAQRAYRLTAATYHNFDEPGVGCFDNDWQELWAATRIRDGKRIISKVRMFVQFLFCRPLWQERTHRVVLGRDSKYTVRVKLLPAVLLLLRIYFPQITVTVTVLKFGWTHLVTITVTVLASAVTPSFPSDSQLPSRKSFELTFQKLPLPLPSWNVFELER